MCLDISRRSAGTLSIVTGLTGLMSVLATGFIAFVTLRRSSSAADRQHSQEFLLAVLPRRLDAIESIWRTLFQLESGAELTQELTDQVVRASIWLPGDLRRELIGLMVRPDAITSAEISSLRKQLEMSSGATQIDALQLALIKSPSFNSSIRKN
jgi:hypothetical protein